MAAFDKIRDKWEAITPRERRMVVVLGVSTIVIVTLYVALAIRDGLGALEVRNAKARRALVTLRALRAQVKPTNADDPVKQISSDPIGLETYVYEAGKKAGLTEFTVNKRSPIPRGKFVAHSVTIELRELTLVQAKDFLEAIENASRVVVVSSLRLSRNFRDKGLGEAAKGTVDLNCEIVTWAKAEETPAGESGAGTAGSAKKGS